MNDQEMTVIYEDLMAYLRNNDQEDLSNIADSVDTIVEEGKIVKEKVQIELDSSEPLVLPKRDGTPRKSARILYRKTEYSSKEKLLILLNTIEAKLINPALIEQETTRVFAEQSHKYHLQDEKIFLYHDLSINEDQTIFDNEKANRKVQRLFPLKSKVEELKNELNQSNNT